MLCYAHSLNCAISRWKNPAEQTKFSNRHHDDDKSRTQKQIWDSKTKQKFSNLPSQNPNKNETQKMYKQIENLLRRNPNGKKTEENLTACNDLFTTS